MKDCEKITCSSRREFLVNAAFFAGGAILTLSGVTNSFGRTVDDLVISIDDKSPLNHVEGSQIVDSAAGKIIVVRTGDLTFVAYSARCTHKNGIVDYDSSKKEFVCPKHGSTFSVSTGSAVNGPADQPLPSYAAKGSATSVTISVSPK